MSEDPKGFKSGDLNLYRYVYNNPMIYNDPYGKFAASFAWWIGKQIIGYPIKKCFNNELDSDDKEVEDMYEEERKKRERERAGCGVTMSCEPVNPINPGPA